MRIHRWSVEGFGLPRRSESGDLPQGLTFIQAADESSKTALMGLVPSVLFGGGNGGSSPNGRLGGRGWLVLGSHDGEHRIEWDGEAAQQPRLVFPDGHVGSRADLHELLNGAEGSLFRSVFVVYGEELAALGSSVQDDDLEAQLLARVMNGAAHAKAESSHVPDDTGGGELEHLDELLERCRARRQRAETLLRLWPLWREATAASEQLRGMESIKGLPSEVAERLAVLRDVLAKTTAAAQRLRRERQQVERQQAERVGDTQVRSVAAEVEALHEELTSYRKRLMALATARARHEACAREFDHGLTGIGAAWGAKRAVRFDLESLDEEAVRVWADRMEDVVRREREAQHRLDAQQKELHAACDSVAAELRQDTPLAEDPLDEKWRALWRTRANLDELWVVQSRGEAEARAVEEQEQKLQRLEKKKWIRLPNVGKEPLGLLAGIAAVLVLWRMSVGDRESAFLCAVGVAGLWLLRRGWSWAAEKRGAYESQQRRAAAKRLDRARGSRDMQWERAAEIGAALGRDCEVLGLADVPSLEAVEECERGLTVEGLQRRATDGGGPRVNSLVMRLLDAEEEERRLADEWRRAHEQVVALRGEWEIWRASAGLPDGVAAERISEWMDAVRGVKAAWRERERSAAEVKRLEPVIADWERKARKVLTRAGMHVNDDLCGSALSEQVNALAARVREGRVTDAERGRSAERLRDLTAGLASAEAEILRGREERVALLAEAGLQDDDELEKKVHLFRQRRELEQRADALRQSLDQALRELGDDGELRAALATESSEDWKRLQDEADEEARSIEEQRTVAVTRTGNTALVEASRTLASLSGGSYRSVVTDEDGRRLYLIDASGQRHAVNGQLDRETKENLYLSVRLGLAVSAAQNGTRMPLVMDDVFAKLGPIRARTLVSELDRLSRDGQILVFTSSGATCETASYLGSRSHVVHV